MMKLSLVSIAALSLTLAACGKAPTQGGSPLPPVDTAGDDGAIVHGRAIYTVTGEQDGPMASLMRLWERAAYAATGSGTVTYTNGASTSFSINTASFAAGAMTGNTLSLGSVSVSSLSDNNLAVCGTNGKTQCTQAIIRTYTTGTTAGFVNTSGGYGAPVYAGALNPSTAVGLNSAGSVQVQTVTIASTKHKLATSDFPTPTYAVSSDFSNAGAGSYSMTFVVEYALQ